MKEKKYVILAVTAAVLMAGTVFGVNTVDTQAATKKASKVVKINKKNFPDTVFRELVKVNYDKNKDNKLSKTEIKKAKEFGTDYVKTWVKIKPSKYAKYEAKFVKDIKNFKGIEKLTNLREFIADETSVKTVNFKKNTKLVYLGMKNGRLEKLNLNKNTKLKYVHLQYNKLTQLKMDKCKKLVTVELYGHMVKNLKIDRNKNTEVYGEQYYTPFTVQTADMKKNELTNQMLDANGKYCSYLWADDHSTCTKLTWNGTKVQESKIALDDSMVSRAKNLQVITAQWQDSSGNFYFVGDANGELAAQSRILIYKANAQGAFVKEVLLNDQMDIKDQAFRVEYLNQKDHTVLLKFNLVNQMSYGMIEFDLADMTVRKQANSQEAVLAAEGNLVVFDTSNSDGVGVCQISDGKEKTLDNGFTLEVLDVETRHTIFVPYYNSFSDEAIFIKNGKIYAFNKDGLYRASPTDRAFSLIYNVSKFDIWGNSNNDMHYQLVLNSEKEIYVFVDIEDTEKSEHSYTLQIGKIK